MPLIYHVFLNIMENGAFALLEQMLHFPLYFRKYSKLNFTRFPLYDVYALCTNAMGPDFKKVTQKEHYYTYDKTCVKQSLSKRQKIGFQDQLSLNAGQKY